MTILTGRALSEAGFHHGFPTRDTADAELLAALGRAGAALGPAGAALGRAGAALGPAGAALGRAGAAPGAPVVIQVKQVHGARAVLAGEAAGQEADALVARAGSGPVGVRVADCVPVLVADPASGGVAAIHAGWRGVVGGVVRAGVELLVDLRETVARDSRALGGGPLVAAIGPCIGACCFEVGRDVGAQIGFVVREVGDKAYVDLRAAVRAQLRALGLADAAIEDVAGCTKHEQERFHSFRRDGAHSGRMLAAIAPRR